MTDQTVLPDEDAQLPDESTTELGSLADRMKKRSTEIESATSEKFPIPNWDDILQVELSIMSWERLRRIIARNERVREPAIRELYTAAEQLLAGTVGFYEIPEDGGKPKPREDHNWVSLARNTGKPLPEDLTPRMAIITLCGDVGTLTLLQDWSAWMLTRRNEIDKEVQEYFEKTQ